MRQLALITLALSMLLSVAAFAEEIGGSPAVSPQGMILSPRPSLVTTSPLGTWSLEIVPIRGGCEGIETDAILAGPDGASHRLTGLVGNPLFVNDDGRVVTMLTTEAISNPSTICVYDPAGHQLYKREIHVPVNPAVAPDGGRFACRTRDGILVIDLATFAEAVHPAADMFAIGSAGILAAWDGRSLAIGARTFAIDRALRKIAFAPDGSVLVLDGQTLERWDPATGAHTALFRARAGSELEDFAATTGGIRVGIRRITDRAFVGSLATLAPDGTLRNIEMGPSQPITRGDALRAGERGIPWPLMPNAQHSLGNTWCEYQNYGGSPYLHPGIDVFGTANQSVYAVHSGIVKAVLTTGGDLYWRIAISDSVTSGTSKGYLYAHIAQSTIAVHVGDLVIQGQFLGGLVQWPIYNFTHTHFARIQDSGSTWGDGQWLAVENPQLQITNQDEAVAPVFEPARGTDLLAFCANETPTYQSPNSLHGPIDIICHVGDTIASTWVCTIQQIRYTIYPLGMPFRPIVNNKESVYFNMSSDMYQGGQHDIFMCGLLWKKDSVCNTQGDYDYREYYHIITNSNGDRIYDPTDALQCWDTSGLPDRQWVIRVTAVDVVGNTTTDSMTVMTVNGNPSDVFPGEGAAAPVLALYPNRPNPMAGETVISFNLPGAERATLSILDPAGRLVRTLHDGLLPAGAHSVRWDGRDARGADMPAGVYFYRLDGPSGPRTRKLLRIR